MIRLNAFVQFLEPKKLKQKGNFKRRLDMKTANAEISRYLMQKGKLELVLHTLSLRGDVRIIELGDIIECNCRRWLAI